MNTAANASKKQSAVILGAQWGDEGKGKIVDVLSEKFDIVARYAGGHNAGHTVIIGGKKFVLQLIPCGVLRPGCKGVIGNGVVLDPAAFLNEVKKLKDAGLEAYRPEAGQLFISNRAQVILPYHRMIELAAETAPGRQTIGTTRRGIGPAYEDKIHRNGLRVADLLNSSLLRTHINNACHEKNTIAHALFGTEPLDPKQMYEEYARLAEQIAPFVADTAVLLNKAIDEGQNVMFEGAQGALLDRQMCPRNSRVQRHAKMFQLDAGTERGGGDSKAQKRWKPVMHRRPSLPQRLIEAVDHHGLGAVGPGGDHADAGVCFAGDEL